METQCCHYDGLPGGLFSCRSQDGSGRPAHDGSRNLPAADGRATGTWRPYPPLHGYTLVAQAQKMAKSGAGPARVVTVAQGRCDAAVCPVCARECSSSWGVRHPCGCATTNWHKTPPVPRWSACGARGVSRVEPMGQLRPQLAFRGRWEQCEILDPRSGQGVRGRAVGRHRRR